MSIIPENYITAKRPARDENNQWILGVCVICGDKSRRDRTSHICDDSLEVCWRRAINRGYIVPV